MSAVVCVSTAAIVWATFGQAETPVPPTGQDTITEVIVTARRREEKLQDVPVAVTALSGEQLAERGVAKLEDLRFQAPAFQVQPGPYGGAVPAFQVRGQRQQEALITQDPSVGAYVDEVYQARVYGLNQAMLDLDNVQVLKGPQGTLFGRNTSGGALLVMSKRPTDQFEGMASIGLGDYGSRETTAIVNVPVTDAFALRAAVKVDHHDGYTTNVDTGQQLGTETNTSYRLGGLLRAGAVESYTTLSGVHTTGTGVPLISQGFGPNASALAGMDPAAVARANAVQAARGFYETSGDLQPDDTRLDTFAATNITTVDVGDLTFKNVLGYRQISADIGVEFDGSDLKARNGLPFFNALNIAREHQVSEELQMQGKGFGDRLTYVVGGYYFREEGSDFQQTVIGAYGLSQVGGGYAVNSSTSLFAQGDLKLTDELTLTAGGRYSWDRRDFTGQTYYSGLSAGTAAIDFRGNPPPVACNDGGTLANTCKVPLPTYEKNVPTWTAGLNYKPAEETLLYATVSRGYRSGGYNLRGKLGANGSLGSFGPFAPEIVVNYEVGVKQDFTLGGVAMRANAAGYHQDYSNIQRTIYAQFPGETVPQAYVKNAASATIDGGELELSAKPARGLDLSAFLSYIDAAYSSFAYTVAAKPDGSGSRTIDASSYAFAGTPRFQYGATVRYELPLSDRLGTAAAQLSYYRQSRMAWSDSGENYAVTKPYGLTDLRLDWKEVAGHPLDLGFYVRNLFDVQYKAMGASGYQTTGFLSYIPGTPRTMGGTLTVHF
ncbi:TonB-dependent receptor [Nitrospirillum viridazoti]|uniref:TonB-dependent receptor n=1 Tax=Nitrospirillum viridazoti TaxID=3144925 RepID=UPI001642EDD1|nr:TonB-dependent receptor [Nitrospirillum amazonense]